jgi:hypothetical protein
VLGSNEATWAYEPAVLDTADQVDAGRVSGANWRRIKTPPVVDAPVNVLETHQGASKPCDCKIKEMWTGSANVRGEREMRLEG